MANIKRRILAQRRKDAKRCRAPKNVFLCVFAPLREKFFISSLRLRIDQSLNLSIPLRYRPASARALLLLSWPAPTRQAHADRSRTDNCRRFALAAAEPH